MKKEEKEILLLKGRVCDFLLDRACEYNVFETINDLKSFGLSYDDLLKLNFDIQDVDRVYSINEIVIHCSLTGIWYDVSDSCQEFEQDEDDENIFYDRHRFKYIGEKVSDEIFKIKKEIK